MGKFINLTHNLDSLPKPKAILLDWDNTLADSWRIIHKCLNVAFREMGQPEWTLEEVIKGREGIHHSLRESFPRLFGDDWEKAKEIYFKAFIACHLQEITLLPGALETIKALAETDAHIAVVSNKTGKHLREELIHLGIDKYFSVIVGATDATKDKPYKEPLIFSLKDTLIREEHYGEVWMVGDSETDIEAAFNTGVVPVLFGHADVSHCLKRGDIYTITNQAEFHLLARKLKAGK
jgi:phosphoglycolate phosphatase